ncbi:MAG: flagellar basal body P-ring protein FlgI [Planctomycetes bacterium]|nr:flagellar basal body P-ring protein FlgI [Planctomycetota bacterium]
MLLFAYLIGGCGGPTGGTTKDLAPTTDLGPTIGSLAKVFTAESMAVEGYGLVGGLNGTGSVECPPEIRAYLTRYIMTRLPGYKGGIGKLIGRRDTAVVRLEGTVPAGAWKGQSFDVRVAVVPGTQTTSLEDGWLYTAELKAKGTFGRTTRVIGRAEGPIFIDKMGTSRTNKKLGYVLAGGQVLDEYNVGLGLRKSDYQIASRIRNRLNERFGYGAATAVSPRRIDLTVPAEHREQKQRFVSIVKATYLDETPEITRERVKAFVRRLAVSKDKYASEIALEAIGKESLGKLPILLNSSDEQVRLRAARCMLNLGSDMGLQTLRQIALDKGSPYRIEALETITGAARRDDAAAIARKLLRDDDFGIRLAAYRQLRTLGDIAVTQRLVARSFSLEEVGQNERKAIYVSRSGRAQIVLFGAPILCRDDIFVQSADGNITVNAPPGQKYVLVMRKHPTQPATIGPLKSSFKLSDIIRALCDEPVRVENQWRGGLGVSYADVIALLKQMCDKGAVRAEFGAGPLPKIG